MEEVKWVILTNVCLVSWPIRLVLVGGVVVSKHVNRLQQSSLD